MEPTAINRTRQVLAGDVLRLPGLLLLGHNVSSRAQVPMSPHIHPGAMELVVMVRGSESYFVDGEAYSLAGGDVFVSFLNQPHSNGAAPQGVSEFYWFQLDPLDPGLLGLAGERLVRLQAALLGVAQHRLTADRESLALLKKSFAAFLAQEDGAWNIGSSLFIAFLCRLLFQQRPQSAEDTVIGPAIRHIRENLTGPLPLEELSALCGRSLSGFKHRFKECTGETPRDYINQCRVTRAKASLRQGRTVTESAMEAGFNSSDYFAAVFKKYTAQSPSAFSALYRDAILYQKSKRKSIMPELSKSAQRMQAVLDAHHLSLNVVEFPDSTRTAQEAADAIGCQVCQIAKSLVFRRYTNGEPVLIIASGSNRVNEKAVKALLGDRIDKADADFVQEQTGYAIGGIPPVGHIRPIETLIDEDLMAHEVIWAAAGTPHAVFSLAPSALVEITGGRVAGVK